MAKLWSVHVECLIQLRKLMKLALPISGKPSMLQKLVEFVSTHFADTFTTALENHHPNAPPPSSKVVYYRFPFFS